MHRKVYKAVCSRGDVDNQCTVYRNEESKTFSNFVDKVIGEYPLSVSSKYYVPVTVRNPNNPYEVLRNRGLLDIARNAVRTRDCSSEVNINFYSEESRLGETMKVFSSNHRFKNGKLVYSSTQELLPELPRDLKKARRRWESGTQTYLAIQDKPKAHYETICNRSTRKKLTDIFQEVERQNVIRRYEKAADKRRQYSRSLSPLNICESTDRNRERYLHTLRFENNSKNGTPYPVPHTRKTSPERFSYKIAYKHMSSEKFPDKTVNAESSSEISVSSKESWTYKYPEKMFQENSRCNVKYKRTSTPSRNTELGRDLFVIPPHTCRKESGYRSHRITEWDSVRSFVKSSRYNDNLHQRTPEVSIKKETYRWDHASEQPRREKENERFIKSTSYDSKKTNILRSLSSNGRDKSLYNTPQSTLHQRDENSFRCYPCHIFKSPDRGTTYEEFTKFEKREDWNNGTNRFKSTGYKKNESELYGNKHDESTHKKRERECSKDWISQTIEEEETFPRPLEDESDSDDTQRTTPFTPHSDSDTDREAMKEHDLSSDSKTSICSVFNNDQDKEFGPSSCNDRKRLLYQKSQDGQEQFKDYQEDYPQHNEESTQPQSSAAYKTLDNRDTKQDDKTGKTKRQINPNKVVHFEDSGRRLSQYYTKGKATLDSERAFDKEEKASSKKIFFLRCSPKAGNMKYNAKPQWRDRNRPEIAEDRESLENRIRQTLFEDEQKQVNFTQDVVNKEALKEYREKYARYSIDPSRRKKCRTAEEKTYDAYKLAVKTRREYSRECQNVGCEACKIERLLGD